MSNNYSCTYKHISSTVVGIMVAGFFTSQPISLPASSTNALNFPKKLHGSSFNGDINILSKNLSYPLETPSYNLTENWFELAISSFYSRFLAKQESLGYEFEKVLQDNLWDLYEN